MVDHFRLPHLKRRLSFYLLSAALLDSTHQSEEREEHGPGQLKENTNRKIKKIEILEDRQNIVE